MSEIQFNGNEWEVSDALQAFYVPYASYVIQTRALPDARDGLKTGARFILYAQYKDKLTFKDKRKKAVATINSTMRFSPHGDASILGTAVRMSQNFSLRYPIMEVQGNNGSYLSGDDYSQSRYIEMRGNEIAYEMTELLSKETVDEWKLNYTQEEEYPTVLPSKFPFALVNGSFGIGVACSSSIPPHNIKDVCDAVIKTINNRDISFEEIYCPIDFPTGGTIINEEDVKESLKNGCGKSAIVRAKIDYNKDENELIVKEMPYMTFTTNTIKSINKALEEGLIEGIESVYDGTDYSGCKIYIKLEKNANKTKVLNSLYKHTSLQNSFSINMNMLDNGKIPKLFTWKDSIIAYINHLRDIIIKSYKFDLKKLLERIHIIDGLIIAYQNIDDIVKIIRSSANTSQAKEQLISQYLLSELQAESILKMKLANLTHLEIEKLEKEKNDKNEKANIIKEILSSEEKIQQEMIREIISIKNKYGDDRRTINITINKQEEQEEPISLIEPEEVIVVMSSNGDIKRIPAKNFKTQKRRGKGIKNYDNTTVNIISTNTIDTAMIFTNKGKVYRLPVDSIPEGQNGSKGTNISSLIELEDNEQPMAITCFCKKEKFNYILFITKQGFIKKTSIEEYEKLKKNSGVKAINLKENDKIVNVVFIKDEQIIIVTKKGLSIRFESQDINPVGRIAIGVKSIKLDIDDEVITGLPIYNETDNIAVFTSNGFGKKMLISDFPVQQRAGKGVFIYKPTEITGDLVSAEMIRDTDDIVFIGQPNTICISALEIPLLNRVSIGNIMLKNSKITSTVKIRKENE